MTAQCELNKAATNKHDTLNGEKPMRHPPYTNCYRQLWKAGAELALPREKYISWLSSAKQSVLKTYIQVVAIY